MNPSSQDSRNTSKDQDRSKGGSGTLFVWRKAYAFVPPALALLTSINSLQNGFAYDDTNQILNNDFIKDFHNLPLAFTSSVWSFLTDNILKSDNYFRPLFTALFTVNYGVFGTRPWGWHLINVLIHSTVVFFVYVVAKEITNRNWLAMSAAALFAVHPVHAESVAWVSGVPDPLAALFLLPAFYYYLLYRSSGQTRFIATALPLFLLAILSKETAIVLPVVIVYCELVFNKDRAPVRRRFTRAAQVSALFALPVLVYLLLRAHALGTLGLPTRSTSTLAETALLTGPLVAAKYLLLMVWPSGYNVQHNTLPVTSAVSAAFVLPLLLIASLAFVVIWLNSRVLRFASLWFVAFLMLPIASLGLFQPLSYVQERYLYLPSIGFCLALAFAIDRLARLTLLSLPMRTIAIVLALLLLAIWSTVLVRQNEVWRSSITLFQQSVRVDLNSGYARSALSTAYYFANDLQSAEATASAAIERDPSCMDAYQNLSLYLDATGRTPEAIQILERAKLVAQEQHLDGVRRIYRELGKLYQKRNDFERAEENLKLSVEGQSAPYPPNWYALGKFYLERGRYEEARQLFEEILPLSSPAFSPLHLDLGRVYDRIGEPELARQQYEAYLKSAPYNDPDHDSVMRRLIRR